ncbi:MAG: hypothetical protein LUC18_05125 [Porphyromonadaceae bacterium]|nr:hypothetical protein [Porphyromonadaceae bacterium]
MGKVLRISHSLLLAGLLLLLTTGCRLRQRGVPRPEGDMRMERMDTLYRPFSSSFPLTFEVPSQVRVEQEESAPAWINLAYSSYGATLWCTYVSLRNVDREALFAEGRDLVYVHAAKASSITAQEYTDEERQVYAVLYRLTGEVATPLQFTITDSLSYLFRGALYFDESVRTDSVAPLIEYITDDVRHLIETIQPQE